MSAGAQRNLRDVWSSRFQPGTISCALSRFAFEDLPTLIAHVLLAVEDAPAEIPLPILKAFLVASQEAIAIGLLVSVSTAKDGAVSVEPIPEKMRTVGIIRLSATSVVGTRVQAVLITSVVGA